MYMYGILIRTGGGGGGGANQKKRLEGQKFPKPVEHSNMTDCISSL